MTDTATLTLDSIYTPDDFSRFVAQVEAGQDYRRPFAYGLGFQTHFDDGVECGILETRFLQINCGDEHPGVAAILLEACGGIRLSFSTGTYELLFDRFEQLFRALRPFLADPLIEHPNLAALQALETIDVDEEIYHYHTREPVLVVLMDPKDPIAGPGDAFLRLHLLSRRTLKPNEVNLDGLLEKLEDVCWTNLGPVDPSMVEMIQNAQWLNGQPPLHVYSAGKIPPMLDYVVPSKVQIADATQVQLGAHLGERTTVTHRGAVEYNAGCAGNVTINGPVLPGTYLQYMDG